MKWLSVPIVALIAAPLAMSVASPAMAAAFDATADFSITNNPDGVWSYGYSAEGGADYAMTTFNRPIENNTGEGWVYNNMVAPDIYKNTTDTTIDNVKPGQISLHPGPTPFEQFSILRFTAPAAGTFEVTGQFFAGDIGSMNGSIVLAGDFLHPLQFFAATTDESIFTPLNLNMTQGETLDFVVGNNGNYYYGNTPVQVEINQGTTAAVPEPDTIATFFAGLGALGAALWRRSSWRPFDSGRGAVDVGNPGHSRIDFGPNALPDCEPLRQETT
jgi:hypothetical protein